MQFWRLRQPPSHRSPVTSREMLKMSSRNLKLIRDASKATFVILWAIFLIHPGRFSTLSYDIVSDEDLHRAVFIFTGSKLPPSGSTAKNLLLLQQLQRAPSAVNFSLVTSYCNSAGICQPRHAGQRLPLVAVVVPYRNRQTQLEIFLHYMHNFLQKQNLNYTIIVVEQLSQSKFNRAKLLNVGYLHAKRTLPECLCFIFHDVDLIPLDDRNSYVCLDTPRHMISSLDEFRYNLPYPEMTGGALAISSHQFAQVNGFSNQFYGWGGEDDEFHRRLAQHSLPPVRLDPRTARYVSLKHVKQAARSSVDMREIQPDRDGIKTTNSSIWRIEYKTGHTLLQVYI